VSCRVWGYDPTCSTKISVSTVHLYSPDISQNDYSTAEWEYEQLQALAAYSSNTNDEYYSDYYDDLDEGADVELDNLDDDIGDDVSFHFHPVLEHAKPERRTVDTSKRRQGPSKVPVKQYACPSKTNASLTFAWFMKPEEKIVCHLCREEFTSRNQLHKHLDITKSLFCPTINTDNKRGRTYYAYSRRQHRRFFQSWHAYGIPRLQLHGSALPSQATRSTESSCVDTGSGMSSRLQRSYRNSLDRQNRFKGTCQGAWTRRCSP